MMLYNDLHHTPTVPPKPKRFTLFCKLMKISLVD